MSSLYAILGFWIGLIFLILGYIFKKKGTSKLFLQTAMASFFIALILFLWWAVFRALEITG
ncbi:MAG: hypothetical protein WAX04_09205 [Oscillospiraceae bacterium]